MDIRATLLTGKTGRTLCGAPAVLPGNCSRQAVFRALRPCWGAAAVFAALLALPFSAHAAGTSAGTAISNSATLTCDVCGAGVDAYTAPFVVDAKINLTVSGGDSDNVAPGSSAQVSTFSVTNNANTWLDFALAPEQVASPADGFDATACVAFVESGTTPGYQPAEDSATFIDELAVDASATVYAVCDIPAQAASAATALIDLRATALGNFTGANGAYSPSPLLPGAALVETGAANSAGAVDLVFADIAGTAGADAPRDAVHSARNLFTATQSATLSMSKSVTRIRDNYGCSASVCSLANGTTSTWQCETANAKTCKVVPGTIVSYQVDLLMTGSGTISNLALTNPIPDNTTFDPANNSVEAVGIVENIVAANAGAAAIAAALAAENAAKAALAGIGVSIISGVITVTPVTVTVMPDIKVTLRLTYSTTIN